MSRHPPIGKVLPRPGRDAGAPHHGQTQAQGGFRSVQHGIRRAQNGKAVSGLSDHGDGRADQPSGRKQQRRREQMTVASRDISCDPLLPLMLPDPPFLTVTSHAISR